MRLLTRCIHYTSAPQGKATAEQAETKQRNDDTMQEQYPLPVNTQRYMNPQTGHIYDEAAINMPCSNVSELKTNVKHLVERLETNIQQATLPVLQRLRPVVQNIEEKVVPVAVQYFQKAEEVVEPAMHRLGLHTDHLLGTTASGEAGSVDRGDVAKVQTEQVSERTTLAMPVEADDSNMAPAMEVGSQVCNHVFAGLRPGTHHSLLIVNQDTLPPCLH